MAQELEYVVNGALMSCNQGTVPQPIIVTSNLLTNAAAMLIATEADKVAMANIPPFGICQILTKSNPVPCMPALVQWLETKTDVNVNFHHPLMSNSCAMCSIGGKVEFLMTGQVPMPPEFEQVLDEAIRANAEVLVEIENEKKSIGETGFWEGMIPLWGSGRDTIYHVQMGNPVRATLNGGFFVLDCLSLGAIGVIRGAIKGSVKSTLKAMGKGLSRSMTNAIAKGRAAILAAKLATTKPMLRNVVDSVTGKVFLRGAVKTGASTSGRGAIRAAKYSSGWADASLKEIMKKFAPNAEGVIVGQKTIYTNTDTGIQIVYDNAGNYFRIQNTNLPGKRTYLDLNGNIPNNKIIDGKEMGRSQAEYNQITHFNNTD